LIESNFKPLKKLENIVFVGQMLLRWLHIEALEIKLKDAALRKLPQKRMHCNLPVVYSSISETTLVAVLASITSFFSHNLCIHSLVNNDELLGDVTLNRVIKV